MPEAVDWRAAGRTTRVKDQGKVRCAQCWRHSCCWERWHQRLWRPAHCPQGLLPRWAPAAALLCEPAAPLDRTKTHACHAVQQLLGVRGSCRAGV